MAWMQVGARKINTAAICYVEQNGDSVRIYFHGQWQGNPLELQQEEARAFWRHLKAEDAAMQKDKGSSTVMPRMRSAVTLQVALDKEAQEKARVLAPASRQPPSNPPGAPNPMEPKRH